MTNKERLHEIMIYLVVGAILAVMNIGGFYILYRAGWDFRLANFVTLVVMVIIGFTVKKIFVFKSKSDNLLGVLSEFGRFVVAKIISSSVDFIALILLLEVIGLYALIGKIIVAATVVIVNYLLGTKFIFKRSTK